MYKVVSLSSFPGMGERRRCHPVKSKTAVLAVVMASLFLQNLSLCWSLNGEGLALLRFRERVGKDPFGVLSNWSRDIDPCSWFGVKCSDGNVVILNLRDLCLGGTLAPELGQLTKLKSIILRNNSFYGAIPEEIRELKELEVLDLGQNNFSGPFHSDILKNLSLKTLLLDNNRFLCSISDNSRFFIWNICQSGDTARRRKLLQQLTNDVDINSSVQDSDQSSSLSIALPPEYDLSPAPSPSLVSSPSISPSLATSPSPAYPPVRPRLHTARNPSPAPSPSRTEQISTTTRHNTVIVLAGTIGGASLIVITAIGLMLFRSSKVVVVKPWVTGLSGQLQKAFVTGVPKLRRSELQSACEDFSNIIGLFPNSIVYKGTLSSGVEIAVISTSATSRKEWSKNSQTRYRKTITTLSKVNHKNFVNLIGFCEEDEPFTRMMVFEYAPNGTLFEHLHVQEVDHLDWSKRLRIAMGMAYCLDHMHQLTPAIAHQNLQSSSIYLTEDYAAKISDFTFWDDLTAIKTRPATTEPSADPESNVYSFGLILFEMVTGKIPYDGFIKGCEELSKEIVDPVLKSYKEVELEKMVEVIKKCVNPDPKQRPLMKEVVVKLKEITTLGPDGAMPKLSPLWWAELEILSTE